MNPAHRLRHAHPALCWRSSWARNCGSCQRRPRHRRAYLARRSAAHASPRARASVALRKTSAGASQWPRHAEPAVRRLDARARTVARCTSIDYGLTASSCRQGPSVSRDLRSWNKETTTSCGCLHRKVSCHIWRCPCHKSTLMHCTRLVLCVTTTRQSFKIQMQKTSNSQISQSNVIFKRIVSRAMQRRTKDERTKDERQRRTKDSEGRRTKDSEGRRTLDERRRTKDEGRRTIDEGRRTNDCKRRTTITTTLRMYLTYCALRKYLVSSVNKRESYSKKPNVQYTIIRVQSRCTSAYQIRVLYITLPKRIV